MKKKENNARKNKNLVPMLKVKVVQSRGVGKLQVGHMPVDDAKEKRSKSETIPLLLQDSSRFAARRDVVGW